MKKTFYYPVKRSPSRISRRNKFACYLTDATKTAAEIAEEEALKDLPEDTDEIKTLKAIKRIGKQAEKFNAMLGDKADKTVIKELTDKVTELQNGIETMANAAAMKLIKDINDNNEKLWKQVIELQEEAAKKKEEEEGGVKGKKGEIVTTKQVQDFVSATFKDNKKTHEPARIEIKAAEIFGYPQTFLPGAQIDAFTGRYIDPVLYAARRKSNLILDNFRIGSISVPKLIFLVKIEDGTDAGASSGDSGGADWILSGEIKPLRSFRLTTGEALAKKVAIFSTLEDKIIKDVASLENWVREDLTLEMREKYNDGLLNNNPAVDPDAPLGMKTDAIQFTPSAAFNNTFVATQSTYIDQLTAVFAMMAHLKEEAGMAFVSWDVYYRILILKDNNLRYQNSNLVYTDSLGRLYISGVQIVPSDDEDIPSTHVLVVGRDLGFKMLNYGPFVFERGLNGEDFRYDRTSYRAYQEVLSYLPTHRENSVVYDTWANIILGIEA